MKDKNKSKLISSFAILLAGCLWGSMGLFVRKYDAYNIVSFDIVAIRAVMTTLLMFVFLFVYNQKLLRIRLKDIWCFFGTGLCSIVFFNYCYFKTITRTSMSVAAVLLYTAPAMVIIMSRVLFKERLNGRKMIALFMTFFGCIFVTGVLKEQADLDGQSILIGLGSGFGYALYSIFSRYAIERKYESLTISFYTFLFAAIGLIPFANIQEDVRVCASSAGMLLFTICFGLLSTVLPYILYTFGLKHTENGKASILASVEPLVATLLGIMIFKENMTISGIIGMILILGGIVICKN